MSEVPQQRRACETFAWCVSHDVPGEHRGHPFSIPTQAGGQVALYLSAEGSEEPTVNLALGDHCGPPVRLTAREAVILADVMSGLAHRNATREPRLPRRR